MMPGKDQKLSSRRLGVRYSPTRQPKNDDQIAGPSHSRNDGVSQRPYTKNCIKTSKGNERPRNPSNQMHLNEVNRSSIRSTNDDEDEAFMNSDTSMKIFQENGIKAKPESKVGECQLTYSVPSIKRYYTPQEAHDKPVFRGPETDLLNKLSYDKLKTIRIEMIRADIQHHDSFRTSYIERNPIAGNKLTDKSDFDERQVYFNQNSPQMHDDEGDDNYNMSHRPSSTRLMSLDKSLSLQDKNVRPPSPPLPYYSEDEHFNSDNNMLPEDRAKHSLQGSAHDRPPSSEMIFEQTWMDNFSSGPSPERRSPEMQHSRSSDHNRHRGRDTNHYKKHPRHSPVFIENHYNRKCSPNHNQKSIITPSSSRDISPSFRHRSKHHNDRPQRRRTPPPRRNRSRERHHRISPRKQTTPPPVQSSSNQSSPVQSSSVHSPINNRDRKIKKKSSNKNQEAVKVKKRPFQSKLKSESLQYQQQEPQNAFLQHPPISFQQPLVQHMYMAPRMPPRPFSPGPMMIPLRHPPFHPPMGAWRPPHPTMQIPSPSGWPHPRPRPFYYPY